MFFKTCYLYNYTVTSCLLLSLVHSSIQIRVRIKPCRYHKTHLGTTCQGMTPWPYFSFHSQFPFCSWFPFCLMSPVPLLSHSHFYSQSQPPSQFGPNSHPRSSPSSISCFQFCFLFPVPFPVSSSISCFWSQFHSITFPFHHTPFHHISTPSRSVPGSIVCPCGSGSYYIVSA